MHVHTRMPAQAREVKAAHPDVKTVGVAQESLPGPHADMAGRMHANKRVPGVLQHQDLDVCLERLDFLDDLQRVRRSRLGLPAGA